MSKKFQDWASVLLAVAAIVVLCWMFKSCQQLPDHKPEQKHESNS